MGLAIRISGQAAKRGLIKRHPSGERLLSDAEAWIRAEHADAVRSLRCGLTSTGEAELVADLHPAADPMILTASDGGAVGASADTSAVGPGYHTFVGRLLERLGSDVGIEWVAAAEAPTDRAAIERAHLAWLGRVLARAREARRSGAQGLHLGTRSGIRFGIDAPLVTALGPRDDAWLDTALTDARVATDVRPWWADATDGRYHLNRALVLMWADIRWRSPSTDAERADLEEALRLLRRAYPLEPSLPYPWREWKELLDLHGGLEDAMARQVADRAAAVAATVASPASMSWTAPPLVGYRRAPVTVVHEGWSLEVPGSFAERRSDEEWWGGEAGRGVTIAAVQTGSGDAPMRPEAFLARVAADLGDGSLGHHDGELVGRARLSVDSSSGVEIGLLDGFSAVTGRGAAIRIEFHDPDDWEWAVARWRALRPA